MRKLGRVSRRKGNEPAQDPSPEEIEAACLWIQAGWSEAERERRRTVPVEPVTTAFININALGG